MSSGQRAGWKTFMATGVMMLLAMPLAAQEGTTTTSLAVRSSHVVLDNGCEELQITFYNNNLVTAEEMGCLYASSSGSYSAVGQYVTPQPVLYTLEAKQGTDAGTGTGTTLVPNSSNQYLLYYTVDGNVVYDRAQTETTDPAIQPPTPQPTQYLLILSEQTSQYQRYAFTERGPKLENQGSWSTCQQVGRDGLCMDVVPVPLTQANTQ